MNYVDEFQLDVDKKAKLNQNMDVYDCDMVTFIGAGGKTTTMFRTAQQLAAVGMKVLVTTTTMIFTPAPEEYNHFILLEDSTGFHRTGCNTAAAASGGSITVLGSNIRSDGKLAGVPSDLLNVFRNKRTFDFILVEGDGSKGKPIKAPAEHEPVVPSLSGSVVGVIGMDSLGKAINHENVHRPALFCGVTDSKMGDVITFEHILKLIGSPDGLFKETGTGMRRYVLLNKLDHAVGDRDIQQMKSRILQLDSRIRNVAVNGYNIDCVREFADRSKPMDNTKESGSFA